MKKKLCLIICAAGIGAVLFSGCSGSNKGDGGDSGVMESTEVTSEGINNDENFDEDMADGDNDEGITDYNEETSETMDEEAAESTTGMLEGAIDGGTVTGRASNLFGTDNGIGMRGSEDIIGNR